MTEGHQGLSPRVLLVGAYERDNFGDLLFLFQTERYLGNATTLASSLMQSDMTPLLGRFVFPYGVALSQTDFDVVWVVGGEVGTPTARAALKYSLPARDLEILERADLDDARSLERALMGSTPQFSAYVPDLRSFERNADTPLILNSVGISFIESNRDDRHDELIRGIRRAAGVAVRDSASQTVLTNYEIPTRLAPDLVHTLALDPIETFRGDHAPMLIQASTAYLDTEGIETFARAVHSAAVASGLPIRFIAAGTSVGHDSLDDYALLSEAVSRLSPAVETSIATDRDPLAIVGEITRCAVWVGTSLHGRIVAASFDRPRISLENAKVTGYAATWDENMPADVPVADIAAAVELALSPETMARATVGRELAELADTVMREMVEKHVGR